MPKTNNKSKRVRDYLTSKPEAPNSEVIEALGKFGVKYHDITNVRASMRKKDPKAVNGQAGPLRRGRPPKTGAVATANSENAYTTGLKFIADAGGIDSAVQILQTIRVIATSKIA